MTYYHMIAFTFSINWFMNMKILNNSRFRPSRKAVQYNTPVQIERNTGWHTACWQSRSFDFVHIHRWWIPFTADYILNQMSNFTLPKGSYVHKHISQKYRKQKHIYIRFPFELSCFRLQVYVLQRLPILTATCSAGTHNFSSGLIMRASTHVQQN